MLRIDGKIIIDLNKSPKDASGIEKAVLLGMEEIGETYKTKFPLTFKYVPEMFYDQIVVGADKQDNGTIVKKAKAAVLLKTKCKAIIDGKQHTVQYFNSQEVDKFGNPEFKPRFLEINKFTIVEEYDLDLAFFLMIVSPNVMTDFTISNFGKVNYQLANKTIMLIDEQKNAQVFADKIKARVKFENYLFNDVADSIIKAIALDCKINTEDSTIAVIQKRIYDKVNFEAEERSHIDVYSEYIKKIEAMSKPSKGEELSNERIKSILVSGIEKEIFVFDTNKWYLYEEGERVQELCVRSGKKKKETALYEFLEANLDIVEKVEEKI